jgi:NCS1 family nucleobase:cation symporter-1
MMNHPRPPEVPKNLPWQVETNGINKVAEAERSGKLRDLFWIWFAANIGILSIVYGAIIFSFGMNFLQGILVILLGTASFFLVGAFSIAGRDGGAPIITHTPNGFGIYCKNFPNAVSWL